MLVRSLSTAALAALLLCVGLLAPVAAEPSPVIADTVATVMEGLPAASDADGSFGADVTQSHPVETPIAFSLVGFAVPDEARVSFRTSVNGEQWTPWDAPHLHAEEGPDPGSDEARGDETKTLSEPVWVGEARHLQLRVSGADPGDVDAHLIDSSGLHRSWTEAAADALAAAWRGSGTPATAAVDQPTITSRAEWGADESQRNGTPGTARRARLGFVHHTVGSNNYSSSDSAAIVRGIYHFHTQSRGWDDIGYNFLVDRYGQMFEGRSGGMEEAVIGAHAGGFNTSSIGVAIMGDFESATPPAVALESVAQLLAWKFDVHHIDAGATVTMTSLGSTRYGEGEEVDLDAVSGHRDVSATACPGGALYSSLPTIRSRALALAEDMFIDADAAPHQLWVEGGVVLGGPVELTTRLRPAGSWTLKVTDPDGNVVHTDAGSGASAASTWDPDGDLLGTFTFEFRSNGRRTATGDITLINEALERIGSGSDVAKGSVAISQAAFVEDGSATHAVIARDDVFADAMAGGPLAGTEGPVLLTGSSALDPRVRSELERVLAQDGTVYVLGGDAALSPAVRADLDASWDVVLVAGAERTETAAEVAEIVLERSGQTSALLARAHPDDQQPWADALSGGAYGAAKGIPVLLTHPTVMSAATRAALETVEATIVLGGDAAVSDAIVAESPSPRRISGKDRTATAVAVATELWGRTAAGIEDRFIVGGAYRTGAWALALAASPLAAREGAPLLVTDSDTLSSATRDYLAGLGYTPVDGASGWALGSDSMLAASVVADVANLLH